MRSDLLHLTEDDLVILANRGLVKRATREIEAGQPSFEVTEDEQGTVTVRWSDGVETVLPAGTALSDARCSCPAVTLCVHRVRAVLAYQRGTSAGGGESAAEAPTGGGEPVTEATSETGRKTGQKTGQKAGQEAGQEAVAVAPAAPLPGGESWDPGAIPDEELARHFSKAALARSRREFDEGHVVELVRSARPTVRIHSLSCTVRFLVPGNPAYTHCDCAGKAPCTHVPLAVWAFRMLETERPGGLLSTHREALAVPTDLLDGGERFLFDLVDAGISGAPQALMDRCRRLENRCRETGLVWPAEILAELLLQHECYRTHDARFSPVRVAELVGELCIRADAIRSDTGAVPQLFIRGSASDRVTEMGKSQLIGLGCGARFYRGGVELSAYAQDEKTGSVVAISRDFPNPAPDSDASPRDLWQLGHYAVLSGCSFAALGRGRLQAEGGKRTPSYRFSLGRNRAQVNPYAFNWESHLRAPLLAESFGELATRLAALPPASLRPRRVTEDLYALPVRAVAVAEFSEPDQEVRAVLLDSEENQALLVHPYTSRGKEGAEALLNVLSHRGESVRFVAGHVRPRGAGLVIHPLALVLEEGKGRTMLQPWVDRLETSAVLPPREPDEEKCLTPVEPWRHYLRNLSDALGDLLLVGLRRTDGHSARVWREFHRHGAGLGFVRFMDPIERLAGLLAEKERTLHWENGPAAAAALLEAAVLAQLAQEELIA